MRACDMFTYPVRLAHIMALFGRVAAKHTGGVDFLVFLFASINTNFCAGLSRFPETACDLKNGKSRPLTGLEIGV